MPVTKEPANAKKVRLCAEALGFECWNWEGVHVKPATFWASTGNGHNAGDVRVPEQEVSSWHLRARHPQLPTRLAFDAMWAGGFMGARVIDYIGKPVELRADYSYTATEAKSMGYTPLYAGALTDRRDREYNDGEMYLVHNYKIGTWAAFTLWFDDMIDLTKCKHPKISPKPKVKRTLLDDFDGSDWFG